MPGELGWLKDIIKAAVAGSVVRVMRTRQYCRNGRDGSQISANPHRSKPARLPALSGARLPTALASTPVMASMACKQPWATSATSRSGTPRLQLARAHTQNAP